MYMECLNKHRWWSCGRKHVYNDFALPFITNLLCGYNKLWIQRRKSNGPQEYALTKFNYNLIFNSMLFFVGNFHFLKNEHHTSLGQRCLDSLFLDACMWKEYNFSKKNYEVKFIIPNPTLLPKNRSHSTSHIFYISKLNLCAYTHSQAGNLHIFLLVRKVGGKGCVFEIFQLQTFHTFSL